MCCIPFGRLSCFFPPLAFIQKLKMPPDFSVKPSGGLDFLPRLLKNCPNTLFSQYCLTEHSLFCQISNISQTSIILLIPWPQVLRLSFFFKLTWSSLVVQQVKCPALSLQRLRSHGCGAGLIPGLGTSTSVGADKKIFLNFSFLLFLLLVFVVWSKPFFFFF